MSERAITEYKIVAGPEYHNVADAVRQAMNEGWQPFGGVSVSITHLPDPMREYRLTVRFAQAMVKYDGDSA